MEVFAQGSEEHVQLGRAQAKLELVAGEVEDARGMERHKLEALQSTVDMLKERAESYGIVKQESGKSLFSSEQTELTALLFNLEEEKNAFLEKSSALFAERLQ